MSQAEETLFVSRRRIHWQRSKSSWNALKCLKKNTMLKWNVGRERLDTIPNAKKFTPQDIGNLCYTFIAK